ncbi:non-ribosomal peptide synthetase [Nonomuraea soli]|uniref:Phenyloxazoline synthase MbtB n=1 Tax=Nonomuraea soli TaxID=1032476 RepID=A0A7W0CMD2_9ACTN|nr:non-ribosomal peptide synthetase [Nonomuraea soli]MBA2893790.1 amino acid adenylation domain-containing protein [Nonomuraea soli]
MNEIAAGVLTMESMRADIADQLALSPAEIGNDADLVGLGLDSLRAMRLAGRWRRAGARIAFAELAEEFTLQAWWALAAARLAPAAPATVLPEVDERAPFQLTPVQLAYWIGRADGQVVGGVGCHAYLEFDGSDVDPERLERAVRALIDRHGMLRARFNDDGTQQIMDSSPWPGLTVRELDDEGAEHLRERLSHRRFDASRGEVFDVQLSLLPGGRRRIHFEVDFLVADVLGLQILLKDLALLYLDPAAMPAPPACSFPRYLAAREAERSREHAKDKAYWRGRLAELPGAPQLPLAVDPSLITRPRFARRERWLPLGAWRRIESQARAKGLTPAMVLAAAYCEVLAAWSGEPRFLINVPLFDRDETVHPDVSGMVADFTNLILLSADLSADLPFAERARALQARFRADARHTGYSGVEVLRDLAREGEHTGAPVVFACNLGTELIVPAVRQAFGDPGWMITQTPQVWLDHQINEYDHGLHLAWDAVEELFAPGVLDTMFDAYGRLLDWLAAGDWETCAPVMLPMEQEFVRETVNHTAGPVPECLLHTGLFAWAANQPGRTALVGDDVTVSYGELADRALAVAGSLSAAGVRPGDAVGVVLPKGVDQVVAVLGVLAAGGVYVPVGVDQPPARRESMLERAGVTHVLDKIPEGPPLERPVGVSADSSAYVIFTSGSTGVPKGVEVSHRAAMNTVAEVNARWGVGADDRVLAVSALDFDLSVYDLFGLLSVGGAVVLIGEDERRDAQRWAQLCVRHGVTIWNSVPTLLEMLLSAAERVPASLRLALVSGDWVGLDLHARLPAGCRLVALGGATEAAIWSNAWEVSHVPAHWSSVPYGLPLRNQCFRVVDGRGRDCPDWVPGELWIGGAGVARGYRGDAVTTAAKFVEYGGQRWYRTGDLGRYWPDGTLEFLGRADHQVKIRGHRLELGEVEAALEAHPLVDRAVVVAVGERRQRRLAAFVTPSGLDPDDLRAFLADRLPAHAVPPSITPLEQLPLTANGKINRSALEGLENVPVAEAGERPAGAAETLLAGIWADLLEIPAVHRADNFFALGGDSLLATRMIARLRAAQASGAKLTTLFDSPVLADFAATLTLDQAHTQAPATLKADPGHRHDPFPPTEVQRAYWLGRAEHFTLGGVGCHFYTEFDGDIDLDRLRTAWNLLIERHEMLRAVFDADGSQRILPEVPAFTIALADSPERLREQMSHQVFDPAVWPLFDARAAVYDGRVRLGVSFDNIILDALSTMTFFAELDLLYRDPTTTLPPVEVSFRDYVLGMNPDRAVVEAAEAYWSGRLPELPPAPRPPLRVDPSMIERPRFVRREVRLAAPAWKRVSELARKHDLTASTVLASAFGEILSAWSAQPDLTLNLTLFDRREVHPDIHRVLGDFTSLMLVGYQSGSAWLDSARRLQEEVWRGLEHGEVSAVWVMRELARRSGAIDMAMPIVFTSMLGVADGATGPGFAEQVWGISQTPQVWLDYQVAEIGGELLVRWDAVEELFAPGVLDAMFGAHLDLLEWLAAGDWAEPVPALLPSGQRAVREQVNDTAGPLPDVTLHGGFFTVAAREPYRTALAGDDVTVSYGELADRALAVAGSLSAAGVRPGDAVGVVLPKGVDQVVAVLGVLAAGGVYVPVGVDQPPARRESILERAGVVHVLTDLPDGTPLEQPVNVAPDSSAYVIFTSGSTGVPKGVEVSHRAAMNTVAEVNARWGVGADDRVLAVSALDFDLSVYDLFGLLSVGGAVVLIGEDERRDPQRWAQLCTDHGVTVWNSVPTLLEMLLSATDDLPSRLRLALVSGDWVGLDLHARLPAGCRLVALGGATEAAIWSNAWEVSHVPAHWSSVPYGLPLRNQCFRVVDGRGRDCPDWVAGESWIGGAGVARGYRGDAVTTAAKFVEYGGQRWYRTGDLGRYWPDGTLEFLGRADHQVKIRGHRLELGEVEAALEAHPLVDRAVVVAVGERRQRRLAAFVTPSGLDPDDLRAFLADRLPAHAVPPSITPLEQLPLTANGKINRSALDAGQAPPPDDDPPRPGLEQRLAAIWADLLEIPEPGRSQSFFALGGDSLLATRFAEIARQRLGVEVTLRRFFAAPTIADCALSIDDDHDTEEGEL